jgi:hypothetical protein
MGQLDPGDREAQRPDLVLIPGDDVKLISVALARLEESMGSTGDLEAALRSTFPQVRVQPTELFDGDRPTWYVYRDGNRRRSPRPRAS